MRKGDFRPDEGYSWVVLVACFLLQFLTAAGYGSIGVFIVEYVQFFNTNKTTLAWVGTIFLSSNTILGIFVGALVQRFGYRKMTIAGSLMISCGLMSSAFVNNIYTLYLTHGLIAGSGYGCYIVSASVAAQHYFDKRRGFAVAVSTVGLSVGVFTWSPFVQWMTELFSWRGALIILSGINLHGVLLGALLRPIPFQNDNPKDLVETKETIPLPSKDVSVTKSEEIQKITCKTEVTGDNPVSVHYIAVKDHAQTSVEAGEEQGTNIYYKSKSSQWKCLKNWIYFHMKSLKVELTSYMSAFSNPSLNLFYVAVFLQHFAQQTPYTYLPLRAVLLGIEKEKASLLISIIGMCSGTCRLIFGCIADRKWADRKWMYACANFIVGLVTASSILLNTFPLLIVYCVLYGCIGACYTSVQPTLIADLGGLKDLARATGLFIFFVGIALLICTPLGGLIIDVTGNPGLPFLVAGLIQSLGGVVAMFIPKVYSRYQEKLRQSMLD